METITLFSWIDTFNPTLKDVKSYSYFERKIEEYEKTILRKIDYYSQERVDRLFKTYINHFIRNNKA